MAMTYEITKLQPITIFRAADETTTKMLIVFVTYTENEVDTEAVIEMDGEPTDQEITDAIVAKAAEIRQSAGAPTVTLNGTID